MLEEYINPIIYDFPAVYEEDLRRLAMVMCGCWTLAKEGRLSSSEVKKIINTTIDDLKTLAR